MEDFDYFNRVRPWDRRKRSIPQRTWSGDVVYKRGKHIWTQTDLARIADKVVIAPRNTQTSTDFWDELILLFQKLTQAMLEKLLPFLSEDNVEHLYYSIYQLIGRIIGVDTTGYDIPGKESVLFNMLTELAAAAGYDITLKRKV